MKTRVASPSVSLEEALKSILPPKSSTSQPSSYSLPNFHRNVFVRMLAAKPKMDILTRRHYPSTLLNKVGITADQEVGAVSRDSVLRGPRVWVSSSPTVAAVPIAGQALLRKSTLPTSKVGSEKSYRARSILLNDIKAKLAAYIQEPQEDPAIVCTITRDKPTATSSIPLHLNVSELPELVELDLPLSIDNRRSGLHLAGSIYKYLYVYGKGLRTGTSIDQ